MTSSADEYKALSTTNYKLSNLYIQGGNCGGACQRIPAYPSGQRVQISRQALFHANDDGMQGARATIPPQLILNDEVHLLDVLLPRRRRNGFSRLPSWRQGFNRAACSQTLVRPGWLEHY